MKKFKLLFFLLLSTASAIAQVFSGSGGTIRDDASRNFYTNTVSGLASTIDSKFGVFGVTINITHSNTSDLNIFLIAPDNTLIELSTANGGNGKNYTTCLFTNNSNNKISNGKAPFKGSYKPEGSIAVVNNNQNPNGTWKLAIIDTKPNRDSGSLVSWNIIFNNNPSKLEPFVNSTLPIILINSFGQFIPDEPKIWANMRIVNNVSSLNTVDDSSNFFNYGITIETRGSSSQSFPKKPYGFTTSTKSLADTNVSLLGLPSEHDWILNATYDDKSLMRDVLAYELARRSGRYATRFRYCELFINGSYEGIYILMEKVKRDKNRVDITKLELKDSTGNALTGGYIVKIDKTTGNFNGGWTDTFPIYPGSSDRVFFQFDYPNGDDMVKKQRDYIASAIYKFETALASSSFASPTKGYRQYADEKTFIDLSIINEISKNVDGYRLSTYMYKDRDSKGGKLKMGPVWDFNLAFNNADYNNSSDPKGWEMDISYGCPFWWKRLNQDTGYVNAYYCRWNQLRQTEFSLYKINKFLDSTYAYLEEASYRNFQRWPVMGVYVWPNPSPLSYSMREEVDSLKSWIEKRVNWMDATLAINCNNVKTCAPRVAVFSNQNKICKNQSVKLYADGLGSSFMWSPAKGLNTQKGRTVTATPDVTSTYKVVMQTAAGCKDSNYITINVLPLPSKTITGKTSFCEGYNTTLSANAGYFSYRWSPATGLDNTNSNSVKASPAASVNYKLGITDSFGCYDSTYVNVIVNKKPVLSISAARDSVCTTDSTWLYVKGATTYKWLPSQGLKDTSGNAVLVYPMNTSYKVIGISDKGCQDSITYSIYNYPAAPISIEADSTQLCYGAGTLLKAKNGSHYNWPKTVDFNGSSSDIIPVSPSVNTTYHVYGRNRYGCSDSASIAVNVFPEIRLALDGIDSICKGSSTSLHTRGMSAYAWSSSTGLINANDSTINVTPDITTTYQVIGTSINACKDTAEITVVVNHLPVLKITTNTLKIEEGQSDTLHISGARHYVWSPATSLNTDTGRTVIATPLINTLYSVVGTDRNQCVSNDSVLITVTKKVIVGLNIPNLPYFNIYPNPASEFVMIESPSNAQLIIYTIEGTNIYQKEISKGFNTIRSSNLVAGLYIFRILTNAGSQYYKVVME